MSATGRPILSILGPTASGKSAMAMALARADSRIELVSVDSMQVYRGMDIGTAKPTVEEQAEVRHHLIDLVDPTEDYSVGRFQMAAREALADIERRGGVPVLVGGTGLHLRAVVDDLEIPGRYPDVAASLEDASTAVLHERLMALDPAAAERMEPTNRRRIIRALEVTLGSGRRFSSFGPGLTEHRPTRFRMVGLEIDRAVLDDRIVARYRRQIDDGFVDEVRALAASGLSRTAAQALGYRQLLDYLQGTCSLAGAIDDAIAATRRFARRQQRWFRRDPRIHWMSVSDDPMETLGTLMRHWTEMEGHGSCT